MLPLVLVGGAVGLAVSASVAMASTVRVAEGGLKSSIHRVSWEQAFLPIRGAARAVAKVMVDGMAARIVEGAVAVLLLLWLRNVTDLTSLAGGRTAWLPALLLISVGTWLTAIRRLRREAPAAEARGLAIAVPPPGCCPITLAYGATNWVALFVQLFLTSLIMRTLGMAVALLVLPLAILTGAGVFAVVPGLWIGSLLNTADNGFSYSINQSAKEALYVPTSADEKHKAKAFIDMFVQRFAKALAVVMSLALTMAFTDFSSLRWLSLLVVAIVAGWIYAARYAGRRFRARDEPAAPQSGLASLARAT